VRALAVSGQTVYVGGQFGSIGGKTRHDLAAVDARTGTVSAWNPGPPTFSIVYALAVSGQTVYVGGLFGSIGGQARDNLAAVDARTATVSAWNPGVTMGRVDALAVSGQTVYVGGLFGSIGGQNRDYLAAVDASTGTVSAWNPDANGDVDALAVSGQTVYVGGYFTTIGGQARDHIAAVDASTGTVSAWYPGGTGSGYSRRGGSSVYALAVSRQSVYVGGSFTSIGGQTRHDLAAVDARTGTVTAWNPGATPVYGLASVVYALAVSGQTVYAGGAFTAIGGQARNGLAAVDASTGTVTAWNPAPGNNRYGNPGVSALAVSGQTAYVSGDFPAIGGQARDGLAALEARTGAVTAWNPDAGAGRYARQCSRWRCRARPCMSAGCSPQSAARPAMAWRRWMRGPERRPPGTPMSGAACSRWLCRARPCTPAAGSAQSAARPATTSRRWMRAPARRPPGTPTPATAATTPCSRWRCRATPCTSAGISARSAARHERDLQAFKPTPTASAALTGI
jgi:predicted small secreted protein